MSANKLKVQAFRANDLSNDTGKQFELGKSWCDFFEIADNVGDISFKLEFKPINNAYESLNGRQIDLQLSGLTNRNDRKAYANGTRSGHSAIKEFFLEDLHLSMENNSGDYFAIYKANAFDYYLYYIPKLLHDNFIRFFETISPTITISRPSEKKSIVGMCLQQIFYGAPGTGKSKTIKEQTEEAETDGRVFRTTFHPDSDYSTFVGCYKPSMKPTGVTLASGEKEEVITYKFTPQAFTKSYTAAWNTTNDVYLIIEEINRGNCAQIFGDLFQLLDRKSGFSEYPIDADSDLGDYICEELKGSTRTDFPKGVKEGQKLVLPPNLYIWATMNTSDQSLFPIDSAFKRRWDWKYIKITEGKDTVTKKPLGWKILVDDIQDDKVRIYDWWEFLQRMNDVIYGATESADKQMGYFFAKAIDKFKGTKVGEINKDGEYIEKEQVDLQADYITADTFVNKVMFYLWTDVMKDNEYSEIIELMKKDGKQLKFTDFFDESGDEVNHEALRSFLDNVMKDAEKKCDVCNTELIQSLGVGMGTGFKPHSVIFKINEMVDDPYERVKGMWRMSEARADKDITKYVYGYATPEKKIVACYEVTEWKKVTDENGKPRFSFDGTPIKDDPMIGQPVEQIAHARGGVVFYTDNWEKK